MQREDKGQIFPLKQPHICHLHMKIFPPFMCLTRSILGQLCVPFNRALSLAQGPIRDTQHSQQLLGGTVLRAGQGRDNNLQSLESGPMDPLGHRYRGWS